MATFKTERFKKLVSYAIKGAGCDKLVELSSMIGIRAEDGTLYLNTTDGTNFLSISDVCDCEALDVTVDAELFSKLISKITSETVELSVLANTLVVKGNGKYTLELNSDENGKPLSFPDTFPDGAKEIGTIQASDVVAINTAIKTSLDTVSGSTYTNYYFGEVVASTDKAMASILHEKVFDDKFLLNREFVELIALSGNDVVVSKLDDTLVAETVLVENCTISVCTKLSDDVSAFNIDGINKFLSLETKSFCRIRKAEILDLLDRLALFVSKFDEGAITLNFTKDGIEVSSISTSGVEKIAFTESKDAEDITIKVNIERLRNHLKSYSADVVDLYYGSKLCIKLVDNKLTQVIALMQ